MSSTVIGEGRCRIVIPLYAGKVDLKLCDLPGQLIGGLPLKNVVSLILGSKGCGSKVIFACVLGSITGVANHYKVLVISGNGHSLISAVIYKIGVIIPYYTGYGDGLLSYRPGLIGKLIGGRAVSKLVVLGVNQRKGCLGGVIADISEAVILVVNREYREVHSAKSNGFRITVINEA